MPLYRTEIWESRVDCYLYEVFVEAPSLEALHQMSPEELASNTKAWGDTIDCYTGDGDSTYKLSSDTSTYRVNDNLEEIPDTGQQN